MRLQPFFLVGFLTLSGVVQAANAPRVATEAEVAAIRSAMQVKLKDADSAKFMDVFVKGITACGKVNAKNTFGGYDGYRRFLAFVIHAKAGGVNAIAVSFDTDESNAATAGCVKAGL